MIVVPTPTASVTPAGPSLVFDPAGPVQMGLADLRGNRVGANFVLKNVGGAPTATCGVVALTGAQADEFRLTGARNCLRSIGSGQACGGIRVESQPASLGLKSAVMSIECGVLRQEVLIEYEAVEEAPSPTPAPTPIITPTPTPIVTPTPEPGPGFGQCQNDDGSIRVSFFRLVTPFGLRTTVEASGGKYWLYTKPFCAPSADLRAAAVSYVNPKYLHVKFPKNQGSNQWSADASICMGRLCPGTVPLVCGPEVSAMFGKICH